MTRLSVGVDLYVFDCFSLLKLIKIEKMDYNCTFVPYTLQDRGCERPLEGYTVRVIVTYPQNNTQNYRKKERKKERKKI